MPRKSDLLYAEGPYYSDWPGCLTRYRWLVEASLRRADGMFNMAEVPICKVCGGKVHRKDMEVHVVEHASALGLVAREPAKLTQTDTDGNVVWEGYEPDLVDLIERQVSDWLAPDDDGYLVFDANLPRTLATCMVGDVSEQEAADPVLCSDCLS